MWLGLNACGPPCYTIQGEPLNKPSLIEQLHPELLAMANEDGFQCSSHARSHIGRVRQVNEDAFLQHGDAQLWAVADGMGGLSRGDYASLVTMRALQEYQCEATLSDCLGALQAKINQAHSACQSAFRGKRIGTTLALLHFVGCHALVVWAGDSRVYRLRQGQLDQLTCDHTLAEQNRAQSQANEPSSRASTSAHVLTRAIGVHRAVHPELRYERVHQDDRYLLCTDGAFNELSAHEIRAAMAKPSPDDVLETIESCALDRGGRDNTTVLLVDVGAQAAI